MKRIISIVCCVIMLMSSAYTVSATEIGDMQNSYTTLSVEFSDNIGQYEDLDILVKDEHVYANAEQLGERLGYQVEVGKDYAAVYNKQFSNSVPYGLTTFYYDSKKVGHMLFNKMVDYEAPIETIKNDDGAWIPLEFSLLVLNSSDVVLDNQVHIEMPQKNIVDLYMDVLKNKDRYLYDWKNDAGASDGAIFAMGSSAYIVQLFNGVLDTDGASWLQLMNGFCSNTDIYDAKYAQDFAKMFCTYSDEEINQSVSDIKESLKPFNGDNWVIKSIKKIGNLYDDKIGELSKISEDLKTKIDAENKASMIAYNKSYQEFEKLYDRADFFYDATDPFVLASDKVKDATSFLDVYYSISQIVGYASEFNNQDKFAMESLETFIDNSGSQSIMSQNMKNSMKDYKNTLETDVVSYSAYNYLMDNMGDWITDALDVSSTILDAKSKALLLAWSLSKGTMPFYKNGLSNTDCFLQSMYAGVVQADTMNMYITKRNDVFSDSKNITPEKLYELSKYCYAYLKSCYITRDAAVGSLTEKTKKDNPTYASTQEMVNKEIASCLVKLKNADKNNKYGCYGFLPEDDDKYLEEFDDSTLVQSIKNNADKDDIYQEFIKNEQFNDYINDEWKVNKPSQYSLLDIDQDGENELIIRDENVGYSNFAIFKYDSSKQKVIGIDIGEILGYENEQPYHVSHFYGEMLYSRKYKAIVYHENGDPNLNQFVYEVIENNILKLKFSILESTSRVNGEKFYTLYENSEKELSQSEYESYTEDLEKLQWEDIEDNGKSIKLSRNEICNIVQQHYNLLYSTNEFRVNEYNDIEDGCRVIVRNDHENEPNVYFTSVDINFDTGNATDELGNQWNIYIN